MPPLLDRGTWNLRNEPSGRKPKGRCFLLAEGANTEYWYLERLSSVLAKRNLPKRIEMVPIERTEEDRNKSNPHALFDQVLRIRDGGCEDYGFEEDNDIVVVVFDVDIYRRDAQQYVPDIQKLDSVARVAVTNPSFELFLLLHLEGAVDSIIEPHCEEILRNGFYPETRRRYIEFLASQALGMNTKHNKRIANLAERFDVAVRQETRLNQNPERALDCLTSNVACVIQGIVKEADNTA